MDITKTDVTILVASTTAVILMSLLFPQLGLAADDTTANESDVPEFTIDSDRFDVAGQFPRRPTTPTEGFITDSVARETQLQTWLNGDANDGVTISSYFVDESNTSDNSMRVNLVRWGSNSTTIQATLENESDIETIGVDTNNDSTDDWRVQFEIASVDGYNTSDHEVTVQWDLIEQPSGQDTWYRRIPVLGSAIDAAQETAAVIAWIGEILLWGILVAYEMLLNGVNVGVDIVTFFIDLLGWLTSKYTSIISGVPSAWASVILTIPGVMMAYAWIKTIVVVVQAAWIG